MPTTNKDKEMYEKLFRKPTLSLSFLHRKKHSTQKLPPAVTRSKPQSQAPFAHKEKHQLTRTSLLSKFLSDSLQPVITRNNSASSQSLIIIAPPIEHPQVHLQALSSHHHQPIKRVLLCSILSIDLFNHLSNLHETSQKQLSL